MVNLKMYQDGPRTILVFENTSPKMKSIINDVISNIIGQEAVAATVPNVAPVTVAETPLPDISKLEQGIKPSIELEDPVKAIQERGFSGYCDCWKKVMEVQTQMTPEQITAYTSPLNAYTQQLKNADVNQMSDAELISIIRTGSTFIFKNRMSQILQQSGYISLEDFLASGRTNLVDAYLALVS